MPPPSTIFTLFLCLNIYFLLFYLTWLVVFWVSFAFAIFVVNKNESTQCDIAGVIAEREEMDRVDRERRRSFKERLGFKVMGCCGTTWGFGSTTMSVREDDEVEIEEQEQQQERVEATNSGHNMDPGCVNPASVSSGMNLAAALAAERQYRDAQEDDGGNVGRPTRSPGTPLRVSLMRLLEEADGGGVEEEEEKEGMEMGSESMCCVCMGRKKGAAFIPCGHTLCRVCSRELWLNRGSCPLCNRSILEILDIF